MWYELLVGGIGAITAFSVFIALPIYLIVLFVIYTHRHVEPFNSEFFAIFLALGVVDIGCYLLYLTKKLFFFGIVPGILLPYNATNIFCAFYYYPFWVFGFLQYQLTFLLALNRFVSIVWPEFYNLNWTLARTKRTIYGCLAISLMLPLPVLFSPCQILQYTVTLDGLTRTFQYGPTTTNLLTKRYLNFLWAFHVYGLIASSVLFYGIMLRTIRAKKLVTNQRRIEMQMFYVGFMVFLLNLVFTVYFFLRDYVLTDVSSNSHIHEWILYFISDIYDLPNGFMLLATSSGIRLIVVKQVRRRFGLGMPVKPLSVSAVLTSNSRPMTQSAIALPPIH